MTARAAKRKPDRKRPRTKKASVAKPASANVTVEEAGRMFQHYCLVKDDGGLKRVAREFGRAVSTVRRIAARDGWNARYIQVQQKVQRMENNVAAKRQHSSLELVDQLKNAAFAGLWTKGRDGRLKLRRAPTINEFLRSVEVGEDIRRELPAGEIEQVDQAATDRALALVEALSPANLEKLADAICDARPAKTGGVK